MKSLVDDLVVQNVLAKDKTGKAMCQIGPGEMVALGYMAGANIRWDAMVMCSGRLNLPAGKLLVEIDSYEYYLDFNTGLN